MTLLLYVKNQLTEKLGQQAWVFFDDDNPTNEEEIIEERLEEVLIRVKKPLSEEVKQSLVDTPPDKFFLNAKN